ncbi:MAG TPA: PHP domain-containing protein [Acidimicrobiales bacterium]|nr:PHP domain-containing protein [Acidimicrobiales bacterium]
MIGDFGRDGHVHSTFSDGRNTIVENVDTARQRGLHTLCLVDHVRADTDWLPDFILATDELIESEAGRPEPLTILRGVETKVLDQGGALDLPPGLDALDHVLVADHQFPMEDGPHHPKEVQTGIDDGRWGREALAAVLIESVGNSLEAVAGIGILAHMFSVLPKSGMSEEDLSPSGLDWLAQEAGRFGIMIEVNERWGCPSAPTLEHFARHQVPIVCATDSHRIETIGRYDRVRQILASMP